MTVDIYHRGRGPCTHKLNKPLPNHHLHCLADDEHECVGLKKRTPINIRNFKAALSLLILMPSLLLMLMENL